MCAGKQGPPAITCDVDSVGEFGRPTSLQGDGGLYHENNAVAVATGSLGRAFRTAVPLIVFKYALEPGPPSAPRFSAIIYTTTTTATQTQTPPPGGYPCPTSASARKYYNIL